MGKDLPAAIIREKNRIASDSPFLVLLTITFPVDGATNFYLVSNTENITFQGQEYTAFPFTMAFPDESSKGELTFATLKIFNINPIFRPYIEETKGGIGATVTVAIVNTAYLAENYAELTATFDVLQSTISLPAITFKLGYRNLMLVRLLGRYIAMHCKWPFKGVRCAYSSRMVLGELVGGETEIALDATKDTYEWPAAGTGYFRDAVNDRDAIAWTGIAIEGTTVTLTGVTGALAHTRNARVYPDNFGFTDCNSTLTACRERGNSRRFGGYPGLSGGAKVV